MARKYTEHSSLHPYHITIRANSGQWFGLRSEQSWQIFSDYLYFISRAYEVKIHAFVMMSNHLHLIASFPQRNLSDALERFLTETSRVINFERNTVNHVYGRRYRASIIRYEQYYASAYRYVLNNPVRANLCERAEQYPFSSLYRQLGFLHLGFPVHEWPSLIVPELTDIENLLSWLKINTDSKLNKEIKIALKRTEFKFSGTQLERLGFFIPTYEKELTRIGAAL